MGLQVVGDQAEPPFGVAGGDAELVLTPGDLRSLPGPHLRVHDERDRTDQDDDSQRDPPPAVLQRRGPAPEVRGRLAQPR